MMVFFRKILYFFCGMVFFSLGLLLSGVSTGYITSSMLVEIYSYQESLNCMLWAGAVLGVAGLIFILAAFLVRGEPKEMVIRDKGELVRIPLLAIRDVVNQILSQEPSVGGYKTVVTKRGKTVIFDILCAFHEGVSIRQEIALLKDIVKDRISELFEFADFRINFTVEGVRPASRASKNVSTPAREGSYIETPSGNEQKPPGQVSPENPADEVFINPEDPEPKRSMWNSWRKK
ncbi:MAG: alkaline shock response membrane anchor protein AmaP [Candidatus Omnitrophica bacterium]|nr:alkaline shock response membrane anchor protein AmaP [Candidatus Omnitrophota bacterium]